MLSSHIPDYLPPGPLISIINRARVIFLNEKLKPFNLSAAQYPIFIYLLNHPDIIQESMARFFHLDKGAIARTLKKMEDSGYISRIVDPDNRRAFRISLTEKAYKIAPDISAIEEQWEVRITRGLSPDEQARYLSFLHNAADNSIIAIKNLECESCNPIQQNLQAKKNQ